MKNPGTRNQAEVTGEWADAPGAAGTAGVEAARVELPNLVEDVHARQCNEDINLDAILDIPVTLTMELGGTRINIRDLLQLNQGSVIQLERMAGEPLDIRVNGMLIAHGEVVVVNGRYGVRLTDVVSPAERVKRLK